RRRPADHARGDPRRRDVSLHHVGVPPRGGRRDRRLRSGDVHERGIRDVDPRRARRVHVCAPHGAARLVLVPPRQPLVERYADAGRHPPCVRENTPAAGAAVAGARDPRSAGRAVRRRARGSAGARQPRARRITGSGASSGGASRAARRLAARRRGVRPRARARAGCRGVSAARGGAVVIASLKRALRRLDTAVGRRLGRRRVVVDARTPMNFSILAPVAAGLERDPDIEVVFTADNPAEMTTALSATGASFTVRPRGAMKWRRVDLCISADPWDRIDLRRCRRRANFFHGVAGKYDLDAPGHLPAGFGEFDRVAFVNGDRLHRYLESGIVKPESAVLVGCPKVDALVNGSYDAAAVRARLRLDPHRRTAIYAPTWSPASSLHLAGEQIVASLVGAGLNVVVKLHDRSLDTTNEKFSGGIDWRARFARIE